MTNLIKIAIVLTICVTGCWALMPRTNAAPETIGVDSQASVYRAHCSRCHGADGHGDTPLGHTYNAPDFTDPEWWRKHSNITGTRTLVAIVSRGKGGMPAFGKKLTRSEIGVLVNHVRRFREKSKQNEP